MIYVVSSPNGPVNAYKSETAAWEYISTQPADQRDTFKVSAIRLY